MGSRYGGLKQIDPVGPAGESILDYSIYDAIRAGMGRVVFVTRRDIESEFRRVVGRRIEEQIEVAYACQELETDVGDHVPPPGRTRPWGTGHAVLAAQPLVNEPFAVVNADDFYGRTSFVMVAEHLSAAGHQDTDRGGSDREDSDEHAIVGFTLDRTLSDAGSVSRGVCTCDGDQRLVEVVERTRIERSGAAVQYIDDDGKAWPLSPKSTVSMNMWGFGHSIFGLLKSAFVQFIEEHGSSTSAEFGLPVAVNEIICAGRARVRVVPTTETWCGITYPQDKLLVERRIQAAVDQGEYPSPLWR